MHIVFWQSDPANLNRNEDSLIAWTWKRYMDTNGSDPKVLLRFPMTKVQINKIKQLFLTICAIFINNRQLYEQWMLSNNSYNKNKLLCHKNLLSVGFQKWVLRFISQCSKHCCDFLFYSVDGQVNLYKNFPCILLKILAWTTAAVDNTRVVGAVPMVMDLLNLRPVRWRMII